MLVCLATQAQRGIKTSPFFINTYAKQTKQMEELIKDLQSFDAGVPDPSEFIQIHKISDKMKQAISESNKGRIAPNKGIPHTEETKKKISIAKTGQTSYWKGKKQPAKAVAKMKSNLPNRKGSANPRARTYLITFNDGRTERIESLQTWAHSNGYVATSVRNLYNGNQVKPHKDIVSVKPL